jgi:hypothetical protein
MMLEQAARSYKENKQDYKALQDIIDQEILPGLLALFNQNSYQPRPEYCTTFGQLIACHVAKALQWQEGSIERLERLDEEDLRQELYVVLYEVIDVWDPVIEFTPYFGEVLIQCLVEWFGRQ